MTNKEQENRQLLYRSVAQILPEKINKMFSLKKLWFIDLLSIVQFSNKGWKYCIILNFKESFFDIIGERIAESFQHNSSFENLLQVFLLTKVSNTVVFATLILLGWTVPFYLFLQGGYLRIGTTENGNRTEVFFLFVSNKIERPARPENVRQ